MADNFRREAYESETVFLKSHGVNPFAGWSDWYGVNSEAVVTFNNMGLEMFNVWQSHTTSYEHPNCNHDSVKEELNCDETVKLTDYDNFDYDKVRKPGVHLDGTNYCDESKVDESFTVIVPYNFLSVDLCSSFLDKLNAEYKRDFRLLVKPEQLLAGLKGWTSGSGLDVIHSKEGVDYDFVLDELEGVDVSIPGNVVVSVPDGGMVDRVCSVLNVSKVRIEQD